MKQVRTLSEYRKESIKKSNVWDTAIYVNPNTIIEGSTKFIPIGEIGFPSCEIDSDSKEMQDFLSRCEDIRAEYHSDISTISKIQLLVSQTLNIFPTDNNFMGRDYNNPTRNIINKEYASVQQHSIFYSGLGDKAAPLSKYIKAKTADCRATNLLFSAALKHVGFDVKWSYIQAQRGKVDNNGNISDLEEPEDHAIVLWNTANTSNPIVLDAYFSEYHGYTFEDLQNGIDRNKTERYKIQDSNFKQTFTLYHSYEQDHGGDAKKPDRIYSDSKNFSGIWKVNDYPRATVAENQHSNYLS